MIFFIKILLTLFFLLTNITHATNLKRPTLDVLALKTGTDKSSQWHNYTQLYEYYFGQFRDQPINFLEIGFLLGHSAHMWEEYFSKAALSFIDIDPQCFKYVGNLSRTQLFMVDQSNRQALTNFAESRKDLFDIIIDDGSHISKHQITSFEALFPYLKRGGVYVIEDLHAAYYKTHQGRGSYENPAIGNDSITSFLESLIHDLHYRGAQACCANIGSSETLKAHPLDHKKIEGNLTYYQKHIDSIHFYTSICFIFKK